MDLRSTFLAMTRHSNHSKTPTPSLCLVGMLGFDMRLEGATSDEKRPSATKTTSMFSGARSLWQCLGTFY